MLNARSILAILFAVGAIIVAGAPNLVAAPEGAREISFFHIHTKESLTIVYKKDGKYIPEAMQKIDWLMRDWRRNEAIKMDPEAIDILWEIHTELGSKEPIHVVCGYRSGNTNEMLRRSVGGQAKNSQHINGKAIDVYFPDVPPKFVRYAGLVRERGGVGYYPTSALPFTHIDTGRVRHWPKIAKDELALLFPSGRSKHIPIGGELSPGDYERAKARHKELSIEVANYVELKLRPKTPLSIVASVGLPTPPAPKPATRPAIAKKPAAPVVAALSPEPQAAPTKPEPKLVAAPRPLERPSRFMPRPTDADRTRLDQLVTLASLEPTAPPPKLVAAPAPAVRPKPAAVPATAARPPITPQGSFDPEAELDSARSGWETTSWATAPAFDEDHPEELSYRPFPLGPMLTASASPDDPALAQLVHPDLAKTLEVIDDDGAVQPMRLRPRQQVAELMWAQQFSGEAVKLSNLSDAGAGAAPQGLANRAVKTTSR